MLRYVAVCVGFLAACSPSNPPRDATVEASAFDSAVNDATSESDSAAPDVSMACNGPEIEDLAMLGSRDMNGVLTYSSTNRGLPSEESMALQPPSSCDFRVVRQRLFRYRMQRTGVLRLSTNNRGTDTSFDTVLFVAELPCRLPLRMIGCNDDDPTPQFPRAISSLLLTPLLESGQEILLSVGGFLPTPASGQARNTRGEQGAFVLTVRESPQVNIGESCDVSGLASVCPSNARCMPNELGGSSATCVRDGTVPGARCRMNAECDAPLRCDTSRNQCFRVVDPGAGCDRLDVPRERCGDGFVCVNSTRGALRGVCTPACSAERPCAEAGRVCADGRCVQQATAGGACHLLEVRCVSSESCVPSAPGSARGRCVPNGTTAGSTCRNDRTECDGALACINDSSGTRRCLNVGEASGATCGALGVCLFDAECLSSDLSLPYEGRCVARGTAGGLCNNGACNMGLTCSNPDSSAGRCQRMVALDERCDLTGRSTRCADGSTCVREGSAGNNGFCRANGTVALASCRTMGTACDAMLQCSSANLSAGYCQRVGMAGGACDPRYASVRCPTGQGCFASGLERGVCRMPTPENEMEEQAGGCGSGVVRVGDVESLRRRLFFYGCC